MTSEEWPKNRELDEAAGGFAMFEARAKAQKAVSDTHWRTGFHPAQRQGSEPLIVHSILDTFVTLFGGDLSAGGVLVDVGGGSGQLCEDFTVACADLEWVHVVVDSEPMLAHLKPHPNRVHIEGRFPDVLSTVESLPQSASLVVAYSVLQYVIRDMPAMEFLDGICRLLRPGAVAVIGDNPNRDRRKRHLDASGERISLPDETGVDLVTDSLVLDSCGQIREMGLDAFCLPQHRGLKTWDHREDLWIQRPNDASYLEVWQ